MADKDANLYWISMNRFVTFLTVLDIFDRGIQRLGIKKWRNQKGRPMIKFEYKVGWNSVLRVFDIIDYKLEFITQKLEAT